MLCKCRADSLKQKSQPLIIKRLTFKKWPHRDSNPDQKNRNLPFYPLNYGAVFQVANVAHLSFDQTLLPEKWLKIRVIWIPGTNHLWNLQGYIHQKKYFCDWIICHQTVHHQRINFLCEKLPNYRARFYFSWCSFV